MANKQTERDLVLCFKNAKTDVEKLETQLKDAKKKRDDAESALIELLEANSAIATAKYEGLGYARAMKPKLYANCTKGNEQKLFDYLKKINRSDMLKESAIGLNTFVSEIIESGKPVPEFIGYYLKASIRLFD